MAIRTSCRHHASHPVCCILPPHILAHLAKNGTEAQKNAALHNLHVTGQFRGQRQVMLAVFGATPAGTERRTIFDAGTAEQLPGKLVRGEGDPASKDVCVNEAYDGCGATYDFYKNVFKRNSVDDRGMRLDSTVHYGVKYDNAFWNGQQMIYGDGDGELFNRFTISLDVIGHELTHGVTQYEASLEYHDEPGALNESMSDVFGSMVKQYAKKQTVKQADWLIGEGLLAKGVKGVALRSMKDPGSAYDDPRLGHDPQPNSMKGYVKGPEDNGGVHVNSGIPNRAFYLAAMALSPSGHAWDKAGPIWYEVLCNRLRPNSGFADCAKLTIQVAKDMYGATAKTAVQKAWKTVGL
jgi:Zn-dependent metalloprotease